MFMPRCFLLILMLTKGSNRLVWLVFKGFKIYLFGNFFLNLNLFVLFINIEYFSNFKLLKFYHIFTDFNHQFDY